MIAIIVLIYLHRRNVRKLRSEDANDKHRSLDFGMDVVGPPSKGGPMQEAGEKDNPFSHHKGVSLDIGHPYLLPPGLHGSEDSFNSQSKPVRGQTDRFHQAASIMTPDDASVRSYPHAQRMSRAYPMSYNAPSTDNNPRSPANDDQGHMGLHFDFPPHKSPSPGPVENSERNSGLRSSSGSTAADLRKSNAHLASAIHRDSLASDPFRHPEEESDTSSLGHPDSVIEEPAPAHLQSDTSQKTEPVQTPRISLPASDGGSDYSNHRKTNATIPAVNISGAEDNQGHDERPEIPAVPLPEEPPQSQNQGLDPRRDTRRMTFGLRPLPPEDPSDDPEQRANRIRSFYKEYFDESKTGRETTYIEDYGPEYYPYPDDDMAYDPVLDDYYGPPPVPFAEPVTRRAMTPPPRAPPRFQGHMATNSSSGWSGFSGGSQYPGPRALSSVSNRMPGPRAPRRPAPPPAPLNVLPTPHMLKDDSIMTAIEFAPGRNVKDQREGRPETPQGGMRPFSPMARAATPLASPFEELSAMPSP